MINTLPPELICKIFQYVDFYSLLNLTNICDFIIYMPIDYIEHLNKYKRVLADIKNINHIVDEVQCQSIIDNSFKMVTIPYTLRKIKDCTMCYIGYSRIVQHRCRLNTYDELHMVYPAARQSVTSNGQNLYIKIFDKLSETAGFIVKKLIFATRYIGIDKVKFEQKTYYVTLYL